MDLPLTIDVLLRGYAAGIFPMAESRLDDQIFWVDPKHRGIFPLDKFHISRSLSRSIATEPFTIRTNTHFDDVVSACANREETWINAPLLSLYSALHRAGHAHSLEVWDGPDLVGGVYGVTLGAAFFGESMFSLRTDASKIALAYLIDRLRLGGFQLFDTQFLTQHLQSLGAVEITRAQYQHRLKAALALNADFNRQSEAPSATGLLHRNTHMSKRG